MSSHHSITFIAKPASALKGEIRVPGDKSISHRSIMFGALADGDTYISGFLEGGDSLGTLQAFRDMGVKIEGPVDGRVVVHGVGLHGLKKTDKPLDMGNSGTSMRLMAGILAGQSFDSTMVGDNSLSRRPMGRVITPLTQMGAKIDSKEGKPPLFVHGGQKLKAIRYDMPMASAQVKSCVLLAGLYADGETSVTEPEVTRDHTEHMLRAFGYDVNSYNVKIKKGTSGKKTVSLKGGGKLKATSIDVPADISSAAFFLVAASITPGSDITLMHVCVNPTRTGVIDILKLMGANLELLNQREVGGEPVADIRVRYRELHGIDIPSHLVPLAIDEFPVLFVAAACAKGKTVLTGAEELRVKESDRIHVMADGLTRLGISAAPTPDGIVIEGGKIGAGTVESHDDHRISMSFSVAGLRASGAVRINNCNNVATSFPNFVELAKKVGFNLETQA